MQRNNTIPIAELLDLVLQGDTSARNELDARGMKKFTAEDIQIILAKIEPAMPYNPIAKAIRAYMHEFGLGGPVDYPAAIQLFDQAILLGNAVAMNNRANMHVCGQGGPVDYTAAITLYLDALSNTEKGSQLFTVSLENLSKIVTHPHKLPAKLICRLLNSGFLPEDKIACFKNRTTDLLAYFRTLPEPEQYDMVTTALDPSCALGKLFSLPEGLFKSLFTSGKNLSAKSALDELKRSLDENRYAAKILALTPAELSPLEPVFIPRDVETTTTSAPPVVTQSVPVVKPAAPVAIPSSIPAPQIAPQPIAPVAPQLMPIYRPELKTVFLASSPYSFTNQMNNAPKMSDMPTLPSASVKKERVKH